MSVRVRQFPEQILRTKYGECFHIKEDCPALKEKEVFALRFCKLCAPPQYYGSAQANVVSRLNRRLRPAEVK